MFAVLLSLSGNAVRGCGDGTFFFTAIWEGHRSLQVTIRHRCCCCHSWACLVFNYKLLPWHTGLKAGEGVWGILSPPVTPRGPFVAEAKPLSTVFLGSILLCKSKGHSVVESICKTQKRVVEFPYVTVNLCLSRADQNGLDSECLRGTAWTSFLVLCFPFIRMVGGNNIWSFEK